MALGWALYGLWVVFLVIAGRAKVTTRNFPAALAGPGRQRGPAARRWCRRSGIAGAGVALCGAYVVMIAVMHLLTRRAFAASFEWLRLAQLAVVLGGMSAAGELLLPTQRLRRAHHARRGAGRDAAGAAGHRVRAFAGARAGAGAARAERGEGLPVSRPEVSVVMPFAGDEGAARAAIDALLALDLRVGDELILADNSGRRGGPRRRRGDPGARRAVAGPRPQRRGLAARTASGSCSSTPTAARLGACSTRTSRAPVRGRRRRAGRRGGAAVRRRHARLALRVGAQLPLPGGPPEPSLPAARGGGQPAGPPRGVRAGRRLLRGRAGRRGHGLQLAPATGRLEARGPPRRAVVEHRYRATIGELRRQWRGYAAGRAWLARRYDGFEPEPAVTRALGRLRHRTRRQLAPAGPPRARRSAVERRAGSSAAATSPSTRCCRRTSWPGWRCRTGPRGRRRTAADVVVVADRFPVRGDPLVEFARALDGARVEAAARPESPDPDVVRALQVDYREDDGIAARAAALAARPHPPSACAAAVDVIGREHRRAAAVRARARGPAPGAGRARARPRARRRRDPRDRPPDRAAGRAAARRGAHGADASPHRRPVGVHASLRPRAVGGARERRRRGRADHQPIRLRRGARARRLRGARAVLPPRPRCRRVPGAARRPSCSSTCPTCSATAACARTADVVHFQWLAGPGDRPLSAPAPPDGPDRPRPAPARAAAGPGVRPAAPVRGGRRDRRALAIRPRPARVPRLGVDPAKVRVIPHGAFKHLTLQPGEAAAPDELQRVTARS